MLHAANIKDFVIFLVVAGVVVPLFHRARIGTVLGFLIAGAALGPHGLGRFADQVPWLHFVTFEHTERGALLAELGIVMLLFLLGLELSLQRFWHLRRYVLGVGLAQVLCTAAVLAAEAMGFGASMAAAVVLGSCFALSSTAIVMQILAEQNRVAMPVGRLALSVLLFQDLMVVPILVIVGLLGGNGEAGAYDALALFWAFSAALGAVVAIMLAGRFVMRPLLHQAVRTGSRDLIMALAVLILVSASIVTGLAGLSAALGAFLAGLLLSDSEARHHIEVDLEPFKGLLLGIFFVTVGSSLDLAAAARDAGWIALALVLVMTAKAFLLYAVARIFAIPRGTSAEVATLLAQSGEFAFVVIGAASSLLDPRLAAGAVTVVALSMMLTPLAALGGRKLMAWLEKADHRGDGPEADLGELEDHVVIGGCGRVGRTIADALETEKVAYVCVDTNADAVAAMRKEGRPAYYGDGTRPELLEKVGGGKARAFVVTLDRAHGAERMVRAARQVNRRAFIFARAADHKHAARLVKLGAFGVIPETVEASIQLTGRLLEGLDLPEEVIERRMNEMRATEIARLDEAELAV